MNNRIKMMLDDATEVMDVRRTGTSYNAVDYKEFADSIIRACIEQVSSAKTTNWAIPPTQEQVVWDCIHNIREYFYGEQ